MPVKIYKAALKYVIIPGAEKERQRIMDRQQPKEIFSQTEEELSQAPLGASAPDGTELSDAAEVNSNTHTTSDDKDPAYQEEQGSEALCAASGGEASGEKGDLQGKGKQRTETAASDVSKARRLEHALERALLRILLFMDGEIPQLKALLDIVVPIAKKKGIEILKAVLHQPVRQPN